MKKQFFIAAALSCAVFITTNAKHIITMPALINPQDVVNIESNFNNVLRAGKSGKYELYKFPNGDKVMLSTIGSKATGLVVMNSQGQIVPTTLKKTKVVCHLVSKDRNGTVHVFTVGCGKGLEDFIGKY